jgi:hypothetical protein
VTVFELLARCRAVLGDATERHEVAVYDRLPRHPGTGDGRVAHRMTIGLDRVQVDDLVHDLDNALTGGERDYTVSREAALAAVLALRPGDRDTLLVDLLVRHGGS